MPHHSIPPKQCAQIRRRSIVAGARGNDRRRAAYADNNDERCGAYDNNDNELCSRYNNNDEYDNESLPLPVHILRLLLPHLSGYLRTRQTRRGRPRRDEFVYACDKVCACCGGG